jgi:hypothetical protein
MAQWKVLVTDNHKEESWFVVVANSERQAEEKGRQFFKQNAPRGTWIVSVKIEPDRVK